LLVALRPVTRHARHYTSRVQADRLARREFLRIGALGALGAAIACSNGGPSGSPSPSGIPSGSTSTGPRSLAWSPLAASGPPARRDHSLTANDQGTISFLFGGRTGTSVLADLWVFERSAVAWQKLDARGPAARFGHSAAFVSGHLVVFGGQGGPGRFFNDAWAFDPVAGTWAKLAPQGAVPEARYGAGGSLVGSSLVVSHGFTDSGRFDDTWALASGWTDVSPKTGTRPVKRCLHRTVFLPGLGRMVLFGGQTTGTPFLGDTWLYDPNTQSWTEVKRPGPTARNLYAAAGTANTLYLFGGAGVSGALADTWSFDNSGWKKLSPGGSPPPARSGVEGAVMAGPSILVFGGTDGKTELADLWELTLPA
jgi:N-acetylneuraminic acid mutarotase